MALTGELSDLSLAELIEFFCNQRKTGRLKVTYPKGPGYFYLHAGSVVDAKVGVLRGIEAVYYALTLPNASFTFSRELEAPERTINQPWTSVVLEGLRRMDEGIKPANAFPEGSVVEPEGAREGAHEGVHESARDLRDKLPPPRDRQSPKDISFAFIESLSAKARQFPWQATFNWPWGQRPWALGAAMGALGLVMAAVAIPWGWYAHNKTVKAANQVKVAPLDPPGAESQMTSPESSISAKGPAAPASSEAATPAAKSQREARPREPNPSRNQASAGSVTNPSSSNSRSKKVTVQVTYDENGRVTQASGADPNALRIARQKRFPTGKGGSATVTIPID